MAFYKVIYDIWQISYWDSGEHEGVKKERETRSSSLHETAVKVTTHFHYRQYTATAETIDPDKKPALTAIHSSKQMKKPASQIEEVPCRLLKSTWKGPSAIICFHSTRRASNYGGNIRQTKFSSHALRLHFPWRSSEVNSGHGWCGSAVKKEKPQNNRFHKQVANESHGGPPKCSWRDDAGRTYPGDHQQEHREDEGASHACGARIQFTPRSAAKRISPNTLADDDNGSSEGKASRPVCKSGPKLQLVAMTFILRAFHLLYVPMRRNWCRALLFIWAQISLS